MPHWIFPQFPSLIDLSKLPDGEPEPEETHEIETRVPLFSLFRGGGGGGNLKPTTWDTLGISDQK